VACFAFANGLFRPVPKEPIGRIVNGPFRILRVVPFEVLARGLVWSGLSGDREMKDQGSGDAGRDGKDSAPSPVRENAQGQYQQASQYRDFDGDRSHRLTGLSPIQGAVGIASLLRLPRTRSAIGANGPMINAVPSQALVDLSRSRAMS
jgi:hypothetical protein